MLTRILLISFLLAGLVGRAQDSFPMQESSLLWKLEGPGIKKGCYLFGTMHLIEKERFYFPEKLRKLAEKADVIVM
ncbi:MAG: TraB/GumN family protein, partial [Flavobacteriales bacterium]